MGTVSFYRHAPDNDHRQSPPPLIDDDRNNVDIVFESKVYEPQMQRNRSTIQVVFMAFVLASIPYGLATTLGNPITTGGPANIIWGWVAVSSMIICVAASLGEITSVYPTAGGTSSHSNTRPGSICFYVFRSTAYGHIRYN